MSNLLRQINDTWELHDHDDRPRGVGCLAFVVDERCVVEDGTEYRLAVSFGDNIWPDDEPKGILTPHPMPGRFCFGLHDVGTRAGRMAVFGMWMDAWPAGDCQDVSQAEDRARSILAAYSDEDYLRLAGSFPARQTTVATSRLLPLEQYELVHDVEL
jgi:hypothetical protein